MEKILIDPRVDTVYSVDEQVDFHTGSLIVPGGSDPVRIDQAIELIERFPVSNRRASRDKHVRGARTVLILDA